MKDGKTCISTQWKAAWDHFRGTEVRTKGTDVISSYPPTPTPTPIPCTVYCMCVFREKARDHACETEGQCSCECLCYIWSNIFQAMSSYHILYIPPHHLQTITWHRHTPMHFWLTTWTVWMMTVRWRYSLELIIFYFNDTVARVELYVQQLYVLKNMCNVW